MVRSATSHYLAKLVAVWH